MSQLPCALSATRLSPPFCCCFSWPDLADGLLFTGLGCQKTNQTKRVSLLYPCEQAHHGVTHHTSSPTQGREQGHRAGGQKDTGLIPSAAATPSVSLGRPHTLRPNERSNSSHLRASELIYYTEVLHCLSSSFEQLKLQGIHLASVQIPEFSSFSAEHTDCSVN